MINIHLKPGELPRYLRSGQIAYVVFHGTPEHECTVFEIIEGEEIFVPLFPRDPQNQTAIHNAAIQRIEQVVKQRYPEHAFNPDKIMVINRGEDVGFLYLA